MALNDGSPLRVLITGAYGLIGNAAYARLAAQPERFEVYAMVRRVHRSIRISKSEPVEIPESRLRIADLRDAKAIAEAVQGIDVVVHLAADPEGTTGWQSVLESNIDGVYNVYEACRAAGVRRVIFASTNQVVFGYRALEPYRTHFAAGGVGSASIPIPPIRHDQQTMPPNTYACSKLFGESLASMYAQRHGVSSIVLRIGWVTDGDLVPFPALFCSTRDVVHAIERAVLAPESIRYEICFVQSDNHPNFVDIEHTREVLGYSPQDRGEDHIAPDDGGKRKNHG